MKVTKTFRHMDATEAIKSYVDEKLQKLTRHLQEPAEVNVVFSVERYLHSAEFHIVAKQFNAHIEEQSDDMYRSIDLAVERIEKVARRHKEKTQDKASNAGSLP